jgi:hypothetical protein
MWLVSCWLSTRCRYGVPIRSAMCLQDIAIDISKNNIIKQLQYLYEGWLRKNFRSLASACLMSFRPSISLWLRFTTPMYPGEKKVELGIDYTISTNLFEEAAVCFLRCPAHLSRHPSNQAWWWHQWF